MTPTRTLPCRPRRTTRSRPAIRCALPANRFRSVRRGGTVTAQTATITTTGAGSWTAPANIVGDITVHCTGGGGGSVGHGSNANYSGGRGAAGGSYARKTFTVSPGQNISYSVGGGGARGTGGSAATPVPGTVGGTTWFSSNNSSGCVAVGGAPSTGSAAGAGTTTGCYGTIVYAGGNGGPLNGTDMGGCGGGGASRDGAGGNGTGTVVGAGATPWGGNGGQSGTTDESGNNGSNYGGGASGTTNRNFFGGANGRDGAQGLLVIEYNTIS